MNRTSLGGFRSAVPFLLLGALAGCGPTESRVADEESDPKAIAGAIAQILARPADRLVLINGYPIDTDFPALTYQRLPNHLRAADALGTGFVSSGKSGLYLVQFTGPIQESWLADLRATGAHVISYVPNNAYVVTATADSARALSQLKAQHGTIRFFGNYEPGFRLAPPLRLAASPVRAVPVKLVVQVINDETAAATIDAVRAIAADYTGNHEVLGFRNVYVTVDSTRVDEIAQLEGVFAVEPRGERRRLDEVQGQVLAGNLIAGHPTGPGYLSWLNSRGFAPTQFSSFAVEVTDDAYSLAGHADLPSQRIAFENNPSNQSGEMGGHGFLNSHIIGGFNSGIGAPYQDENGFQFNMGIAPYARLGVTAIFGEDYSTPSLAWEAAAYAKGARISSNSWGYTSGTSYDTHAQEYDVIVRDTQKQEDGHQPMIVVFAAGNSGEGPSTVGTPGTAKNVISVGAGENVRPWGPDGCNIRAEGADNAEDVIWFSSRGPVNPSGGDARFKPDLVAPGTHVQGGVPSSNYDGSSVCNKYFPAGQTLYGWSSGTSHSCPAVAGGAALVYQHFLNQNRPAPSPAMVKAYLMSSASHMTGEGANDTLPSNNQGMGRMNLGRAFDDVGRLLVDQTQVLGATGDIYQVTGSVVSSSAPFRVTLAWTDAPGPTTGAPYVNNLDLEVALGGVVYKGNVFSGPTSVRAGEADRRNNVESVFLPAGVGGSFVVRVKGTNIAGDGVPGSGDDTDQDFALVIYNGTEEPPSQPYIGLGADALTFKGIVEGATPPNQSFTIVNTGVGTLNWSLTSSAPWLSAGPPSGTAPTEVTASVDMTGLSAGTYTAELTVSAPGAANSPAVIPVVLLLTPMGTALYSETFMAPECAVVTKSCTAPADLLEGRGTMGPEPHASNTIGDSCLDGNAGNFHVDESIDALSVSTTDGSNLAPGKQVRIDATVFVYSTFTDFLDLYFAGDATSPNWQHIATIQATAQGSQVYSATYTLPEGGSRQAVRAAFRYKGDPSACTLTPYDDRDDLVFAVGAGGPGDLTPPTTAITSPEDETTVSGSLTIAADASDNVAVTRVEFYVDGTLLADDTSAPYSAVWATRSVFNGSHTVFAKAFDAAGNLGVSKEVEVKVYNDISAPSVTLTAPAEGAQVSGSVSITAAAEDDIGVEQVEFLVDGAVIGTSQTPPYAVVWNTTGAPNGEHQLVARASDAAGNLEATAPVKVLVQNLLDQPARYDTSLGAPRCFVAGASCDSGSLLSGRGNRGPEQNAPNTIHGSCADGTIGVYQADESLEALAVTSVSQNPLRAGSVVRIDATVWAESDPSRDFLDLYAAADASAPDWQLIATLSPKAAGPQKLSATYTLPSGPLQAIRGQFRYGKGKGPCSKGKYNDRDDLIFAVLP